MTDFNFGTGQDAMAALYKHLQVALANHGVTFILVPLADAIAETANADNLGKVERQLLTAGLTHDFSVILSDALDLTRHIMSGTK